jgi:hypothetical protein
VRKFIISSVIGGSWVAGWISQPDPNPEIAGDRRKPAHSLRRFTGSALASGLATASYTINWDTTRKRPKAAKLAESRADLCAAWWLFDAHLCA